MLNRVRYLLFAIVAGGLIGLLLLSFWPASWATGWLNQRLPGVRLQQVSGSLWHGFAGEVRSVGGVELGQARWQLSPLALLGRTDLHLQLKGRELGLGGQLRGDSADRYVLDNVRLRTTPALVSQVLGLPPQAYAGQIYVELSHAVLWHGWPMELEGQLSWRDASVKFQRQALGLGNLLLRARSQQGVLSAQLDDDGSGPLVLQGHGQLTALGWRWQLDAGLRRPDPATAAWLAQFGTPDAHGMVHIQRAGGLFQLGL